MFDSGKFEKGLLDQIFNLIKLASLSFPAIAFFQYSSKRYNYDSALFFQHDILLVAVLFTILAIYVLWSIFQNKTSLKPAVKSWIDSLISLSIALLSVLLTGTYESPYKYLFFLVIIYSSMECSMRSSMAIAVISAVAVLAVDLIFVPAGTVNAYFESDIILASVFLIATWTISFYVDFRKRYIQSLKDLANIDGLTGIYNHRYFYEALSREYAICKKAGAELSLLFVDIDNFKYYNDLYGHQKGDETLKTIAKILGKNVPSDKEAVIARYGGEEFAILLPKVGDSEAVKIAELIRNAVEEHEFEGQESLPGANLTVSIGISSYPKNAKTEDEIIKYADDACYRAKFMRKNRVETYYSILDDLQNSVEGADRETIASIRTLIAVINAKDKYTFRHIERVVYYCNIVADILKLDDEEKKTFVYAAYLHDIGKINIPEEILMKTERLLPHEWAVLKTHPQNAVIIIEKIDYLRKTIPIILQHHERFDGGGYPNGLKRDEINFLARILTVIDSFDAMTSLRPYQPRKSYSEAIRELYKCSGTQFDPEAVNIFIDAFERYKRTSYNLNIS